MIDGSGLTAINGTAAAVVQALIDLDGTDPTGFSATITGVATAADIASIESANGTGLIDGSGLTAINGTAADVVQALIDLDGTDPTTFTVTLSDNPTATQLAAINNATSGNITLNSLNAALSGTALEIIDGLAGIANFSGNVTLSDNPTATQLLTINNATTGSVTLHDYGIALSASSANLVAALNGITGFSGNVSLSDDPTATELAAINNATTGSITLRSPSAALSGTALEIVNGLAGITGFSGNVTLRDNPTATQLAAINNATTGSITLYSSSASLSGTALEIVDGLAGIAGFSGNVSLTDDHTLAQLKAINAATSGTITLFNNGVGLTGTAANLAAGLDGITGYEGAISITDNHTLDRLKTINNATSATITLANKAVTLNGYAADVAAALAGITDYTGNVILQDAHDLTQLKDINIATSGSITLFSTAAPLEGGAADLAAALTGITTYTGAITVTGIVSLAQLATIDGATSGSVTSGTITDTATNLAANTDGYLDGTSKAVTITTNHTLAQLKAINNATTGAITLANKNIDLSGTAADVVAALNGFTDYTGKVTITDSASIAQLTAIDGATSGLITYSSVTDTAANLAAEVTSHPNANSYVTNKALTLTTDHSLVELKDINNATTGAITLASKAVVLSGSAGDVVIALDGFTDYTGNVTVTANASIADLKSIDAATSGTITLTSYSLTDGAGSLDNLTATVASAVRQAVNKNSYSYAIVDTTANVNAASADVLKSATAITSNDNAATTGSTLNLDGVNAIGGITSVVITGDSGANIVQLSAALTHSDQVVASFGGADSTTDTLILNAVDGDYTTWSSDLLTVTHGSNTLGFNTLSGFSLVNPTSGNAEDRLGIFTTDRNIFSRFVSTSTSSGAGRQLKDGTVFEDDDLGLITSADSKDASFVRDQIAQFVADGGAAAPGSVGKVGQSVDDFIYVAYGEGSIDSSKTSAYVYAGYFDKGSSGAFAATGGFVSDTIQSKIAIVSLAEIVDVSVGDLSSGNFTSTKPAGLS